jgi:hypothetical protein
MRSPLWEKAAYRFDQIRGRTARSITIPKQVLSSAPTRNSSARWLFLLGVPELRTTTADLAQWFWSYSAHDFRSA